MIIKSARVRLFQQHRYLAPHPYHHSLTDPSRIRQGLPQRERMPGVSRFVGLCEGLYESGEPTVNPSAVPQDQFSVQGRRVDLGVNSSSP